MKLIKGNNVEYIPFHESVEDLSMEGLNKTRVRFAQDYDDLDDVQRIEKYAYLFQVFLAFEKKTEEAGSVEELSEEFKSVVKRIIPARDFNIFFFDENFLQLESYRNGADKDLVKMINGYYKEGVLNLLFDNNRPAVIPQLNATNNSGSKINYLLVPLFEEGKKRGVLTILTSITDDKLRKFERDFLETAVRVFLAKLDRMLNKEKVKSIYEELQTYQAKLSNDFRLAAVGELTEGIVEDIVSPLQNIMSMVDLLDVQEENVKEVKRIKAQINKINSVIARLVKFASINQKDLKIQSCNLNEVINDYHNLVKSSLVSLKLECVLDFEKDIPPVLSHPNYIHQILANVFGLIKSMKKDEVGLLLQTRYREENIILRVISTADLVDFYSDNPSSKKSSNMTLRIIENLMKKHEGTVTIESFKSSGSQITLKFPLKRKVRR